MPLADAVVHATRDAAASCLEEHERGRIAPGLAADFAVLDRDPFTEGADVLLERARGAHGRGGASGVRGRARHPWHPSADARHAIPTPLTKESAHWRRRMGPVLV